MIEFVNAAITVIFGALFMLSFIGIMMIHGKVIAIHKQLNCVQMQLAMLLVKSGVTEQLVMSVYDEIKGHADAD